MDPHSQMKFTLKGEIISTKQGLCTTVTCIHVKEKQHIKSHMFFFLKKIIHFDKTTQNMQEW